MGRGVGHVQNMQKAKLEKKENKCFCQGARARRRKKKRQDYLDAREKINPEDLIFIDEAAAQMNMANEYGRGEGGCRVRVAKPKVPGTRITMIAAMGLFGVVAAFYGEWAADEVAFLTFITEILVPQLEPNKFVVMDNVPFHAVKSVEEAIRKAGCTPVFLPPYSPELSPIENMWSKLKKHLKKAAARTKESLSKAITDALKSVTADDCEGWFEHCGYGVNI